MLHLLSLNIFSGIRTQALQDSQAQSQLLQLQEFRSSLSYMQLFFHDYEKLGET